MPTGESFGESIIRALARSAPNIRSLSEFADFLPVGPDATLFAHCLIGEGSTCFASMDGSRSPLRPRCSH